MKRTLFSTLAVVALLALAACGSSSTTADACDTADNQTLACTGSYKIAYTADTTPTVGKSTLTLTITDRATGAAATGAAVDVTPWMRMETMEHGSVVDTVVDNGDGSYTATVYYLMSSSMNGVSMGTWDLKVAVNGEEATFTPVDVSMAMGQTLRVSMKNDADQIAIMGVTQTRTYMLFEESVTSAGMFKLVAAARQTLALHPKIYAGVTLSDAAGAYWTVDTVTVQLSTDKTNWVTMTDAGTGHYAVSGLTGLTDGVAAEVYVKLSVNGAVYTTDGAAANGANEYQTFTVIPGAMGM